MADVVYFDSGTVLPFCPSTVNGIYISGSGCCSDFYTAFVGGNQTYNLTYTLPTSSGSSGQVLTNDGNGNLSWTTISGGGGTGSGTVTGTGTTNYLSKWVSSSGLTNSIVLETGSTIDISGALRVTASSGTATTLMGRDINGYVSNLSLGSGLSISGGTLSFTGSTGVSGNFVPYLGATGNTDLGGFGIGGSYFQFSTSTGGTLQEGMATWNGSVGTADLMLKGGNVTLPIGQGQVLRVRNETGVNLTKAAYSAVRVTGSSGNFLKIDLALASGETTSAETIGIVTENINDNQEGFITVQGIIRGINATGSLQGETWADGDMLFLSPSTPGGLTNIKPQAPNHLVIVGYVVRSDNNGIIFVKIDNGYELNELHNVLLPSSITDNEILAYDSVTKVWRNRTSGQLTLASGTGTTNYLTKWVSSSGLTNSIILETGSTIDIAGALRVTASSGTSTTLMGRDANGYVSGISVGSGLSLSGNTLTTTGTTGVGVTGSGTATQVAFWGGTVGTTSTALTSSTSLTWDNVNGRLGVGVGNPSSVLHVIGGSRFSNILIGSAGNTVISNTNSDTFLNINNGVSISNTILTPSARLHVRGVGSDTGTTFLTQSSGGTNTFSVNDNGAWQHTGNGIIQGTTSDSSATGLTIQGSTATITASFRNDGFVRLGTGGWLAMGTDQRSLYRFASQVGIFSINADNNSLTSSINLYGTNHATKPRTIEITGNFTPTNNLNYANLELTSIVNQTGATTTGTTRGLYVNPTLTSAFDWRSIEWSNNTGYGLYGSGTANNYLAGNTAIGTTTPSARLHVVGSGTTSSTWTAQFHNSTGNNNALMIRDNGNVGINSDNPQYNLDINGSLRIGSSSTAGLNWIIQSNTITGPSSNNGFLTIGTGRSFNISNSNASVIITTFDQTTANVGIGIGITTPSARLHVRGSGTTSSSGTTFLTQSSGGTNTFAILDNGNVGINNASPTARLYVKGSTNGNASTAFEVTDNTDRDIINVRDDGRITLGRNLASTVQSSVTIEAVGSETNIGIAIVPKGNGAITAQIPDGTVVGGNARGSNAVDLQKNRNSLTQVASGIGSVLSGGYNNQSSETRTVVAGGESNIASNGYATVGGGVNNQATQSYSTISGGRDNSATADYSSITGGFGAYSYLYAQRSVASGAFGTVRGNIQTSDIRLSNVITGTNTSELFLNNNNLKAVLNISSPGPTNARLWNAVIQLSAICTTAGGTVTAGEAFIGSYNCGIKRTSGGTALVETVQNLITPKADANMSSSVVTISADTANNSLKIEFTPPTGANASTVIRVVATVYLTEVGY